MVGVDCAVRDRPLRARRNARARRPAGGGAERGAVDAARPARTVACHGAALPGSDAAGRPGFGERLSTGLPPAGEPRLAGVAGAAAGASAVALASGRLATETGRKRRPCTRLLADPRRAGAGAALPFLRPGRALQRLALAGLGAGAEPVPHSHGIVASTAVAGGGIPSRISWGCCVAGGVVAVRVVLAGQSIQQWFGRAAALSAAAQPAGAGHADRPAGGLSVGAHRPAIARCELAMARTAAAGTGRRLAIRPDDPGCVPDCASLGWNTVRTG
ncbi:hypothetical protein D3C80_1194770 [compost metagenome]